MYSNLSISGLSKVICVKSSLPVFFDGLLTNNITATIKYSKYTGSSIPTVITPITIAESRNKIPDTILTLIVNDAIIANTKATIATTV